MKQARAEIYDIVPVPKPRMTRSDKWNKRDCVMRYRAFADECRAKSVSIESGDSITFILPMPKSWSKKKKLDNYLQPHMQKPDIDNLCKAALDALYTDDAHIHTLTLRKVWGESGAIKVEKYL